MTELVWIPIEYRSFYDVPRIIRFTYDGAVYVLDCPFDDSLDEYPDLYSIYRVPGSAVSDDWESFVRAEFKVGTVRVVDVEFDETRRRFVSADIFLKMR